MSLKGSMATLDDTKSWHPERRRRREANGNAVEGPLSAISQVALEGEIFPCRRSSSEFLLIFMVARNRVGVLRPRKDFASRSSYCAQDDRVIFFSTPGAQSQSRGEWARSHLWTDQLQLLPSTSLPAGWLLRNPESETAFLPCARAFAG